MKQELPIQKVQISRQFSKGSKKVAEWQIIDHNLDATRGGSPEARRFGRYNRIKRKGRGIIKNAQGNG